MRSNRSMKMLCAASLTSACALLGVLAAAQEQERTGTAVPVAAPPDMITGQTTTAAVSKPGELIAGRVAAPTLKAQRPRGY